MVYATQQTASPGASYPAQVYTRETRVLGFELVDDPGQWFWMGIQPDGLVRVDASSLGFQLTRQQAHQLATLLETA